ncbi:3-deoxy-D-manno-octulosonic acid transferase [Segetibacter koreensis]|uniref:3-deoxy-D-manno-octulosonic acid transferase n=1 Tax=Segetibacter koreensis TaxID=398037 RepID=UPI000382C116|nr:glycosyltransferase N-terminal domain-containing protein [Segetibacter koreensis]
MEVLYQIFIRLYPFFVRLSSPFNEKAKFWTEGRKKVLKRMQEGIDPAHPLIWMHCASLGEFEQGRPLIEKIRKECPSYKILLTFFSPSGYEVRKNYNGADYIFYLPMDSRNHAYTFMEIAKPSLILFVKYEFWYYYLNEAKKRNIPLLLVSGIFRKNQPFFSKYGYFYRASLSCFTHFFVQNEESLSLLKDIGFRENVTISGDTRFDRVIEIAQQFEPITSIEEFCNGSDIIVAGSTWYEDDKILAEYANRKRSVKFIIAPHNISKQRLGECQRLYKTAVLFSELKTLKASSDINTIIIDNIGMLSRLYKYATITYIGGGFGTDGVHNVLEGAVYGKPVVFGPVYDKFIEAVELVKNGGAVSIGNASALEATFNQLLDKDEKFIDTSRAALNYVYNKKGATGKILEYIYKNRLLTR